MADHLPDGRQCPGGWLSSRPVQSGAVSCAGRQRQHRHLGGAPAGPPRQGQGRRGAFPISLEGGDEATVHGLITQGKIPSSFPGVEMVVLPTGATGKPGHGNGGTVGQLCLAFPTGLRREHKFEIRRGASRAALA